MFIYILIYICLYILLYIYSYIYIGSPEKSTKNLNSDLVFIKCHIGKFNSILNRRLFNVSDFTHYTTEM